MTVPSPYRELTYEVHEPVATITLNRPERLNALTSRLLSEIPHAFATAEADARVVGIVLTGAGRGFSAGADMDLLGAVASGKGLDSADTLESEPGDVSLGADFEVTYSRLLRVRKPILAAVNGPCAGIGMAIALLCDLRFASERAMFMSAFAHRGLIAEHGTSWILPRLVGVSRALDLLWSARRVDAAEAYRIGLVDRVVPHEALLTETRRYVEELAARSSPTSLMLMKQQVYKHLMTTLGPAMRDSNHLMLESLGREDFKEGVASFLEKRPPRFKRVGE